ncbi:uncharacterized protein PITG_21268 [Phytophthora infestans T30-4]|uniref:DUF6818 domain-containing protein n=1 Tax=Phytophthora infestans (strain T30-4) TaxID=403677 RepID=D0P444_PHYIT|nr:uncharacterized protein PITG_21268 [Phytophthora infestans T30-4]EEY62926.1 conserved hypothetical protein [Phytophthora infestans T30-4]|eukprot:XP_002894929.1 conserved hypothetical protein [Phytophthora infestans T30-4]
MLNIVEDILPFGSEQWQTVAQFNTNIPTGWTERDGESLKRKFQKLDQPQVMMYVPMMSGGQSVFKSTLDDDCLKGAGMLCGTVASGSKNSPTPNTTPTTQINMQFASSTPLQAASRVIENVESDLRSDSCSADPVSPMVTILMAMEECHDAREAQYRRERKIYQRQRDERESRSKQMMMLLLARLVGGSADLLLQLNNNDDEDKPVA